MPRNEQKGKYEYNVSHIENTWLEDIENEESGGGHE